MQTFLVHHYNMIMMEGSKYYHRLSNINSVVLPLSFDFERNFCNIVHMTINLRLCHKFPTRTVVYFSMRESSRPRQTTADSPRDSPRDLPRDLTHNKDRSVVTLREFQIKFVLEK